MHLASHCLVLSVLSSHLPVAGALQSRGRGGAASRCSLALCLTLHTEAGMWLGVGLVTFLQCNICVGVLRDRRCLMVFLASKLTQSRPGLQQSRAVLISWLLVWRQASGLPSHQPQSLELHLGDPSSRSVLTRL